MGRHIIIMFSALLLLAGLVLLCYPVYRTAEQRGREQRQVAVFEQYVQGNSLVQGASETVVTGIPFSALREACQRYNRELPQFQQERFCAEAIARPAICLSDYGWEQESFGVLSIPTVKIETPLYLGASAANLDKGAAILGQTSLPLGGKGTHCVIAGHRSWNGAVKFRALEEVQPGDLVYVKNPWETLTYRVIETKTIAPDDIGQVMLRPARDLLSIFTCADPNSRRFLVLCERMNEEGGTFEYH